MHIRLTKQSDASLLSSTDSNQRDVYVIWDTIFLINA